MGATEGISEGWEGTNRRGMEEGACDMWELRWGKLENKPLRRYCVM